MDAGEDEPSSPQVALGSTATDVTSTAAGSATTMDFGTGVFVGLPSSSPVVLPPPRDLGEPVRLLLEELVGHLGRTRVVQVAVALLEGAPRTAYAGSSSLAGH